MFDVVCIGGAMIFVFISGMSAFLYIIIAIGVFFVIVYTVSLLFVSVIHIGSVCDESIILWSTDVFGSEDECNISR